MKRSQGGFSFLVVLAFAMVAAVVLFGVLKVLPVYTEYGTIKRTVDEISVDQEQTEPDVRRAFENHATVQDIKAVKTRDLLVTSSGGKLGVGVRYDTDVPIVKDIKLVFHFEYQAGSVPVLDQTK
ncbi:DUF4845 domain-containing protein [Vogesella sp. LIG4]|uniref:DUF4845 domain-containing protein n=1 Tax=Vogesella sp. LIG4 TaxID=1192162 RepID=UPI00081FF7C3|nr:DUF4845 domain-containing protein [Vogesella sp. LIG4]SCK23304.1 protein of unknown function [Vogesella sp. LIG4]